MILRLASSSRSVNCECSQRRAPQPQLIAIALWLQVIEKITLVEWFANMYKSFGSTLEFITNRSQVPRSIERCPRSVPTTISLTRVCMLRRRALNLSEDLVASAAF